VRTRRIGLQYISTANVHRDLLVAMIAGASDGGYRIGRRAAVSVRVVPCQIPRAARIRVNRTNGLSLVLHPSRHTSVARLVADSVT